MPEYQSESTEVDINVCNSSDSQTIRSQHTGIPVGAAGGVSVG